MGTTMCKREKNKQGKHRGKRKPLRGEARTMSSVSSQGSVTEGFGTVFQLLARSCQLGVLCAGQDGLCSGDLVKACPQGVGNAHQKKGDGDCAS